MQGTPPNSSPPPGAKPIWGSYGAGAAPAPSAHLSSAQPSSGQPSSAKPSRFAPKGFGGEPLDPLSRRLVYGIKILAVLMVLVGVNSFVNSSGSDDTSNAGIEVGVAANAGLSNGSGSNAGAPANSNANSNGAQESNPVAAAAERTEEVSGARFSLFMVYTTSAFPQPLEASGGGVYNKKNERSRLNLELADPISGSPMQMVQITDGDVEYEGGTIVEESLPPGKEWVRTEGSEGSGEDETPLSIDESLEMLGSSGGIAMVGRESLHGRMTRHYRGEVQIGDLADFLRERGKATEAEAYEGIEGLAPTQISAEGWIDGKSMLRRLRIVMPIPKGQGEQPVTLDMRMDFLDYGPQPEIEVPDPATVVEGPLDEATAPSGSVS